MLLVVRALDQRDLVEPLGVTESAVSRKINKGTWTVDDLDVLAQLFRVELATFFTDPGALFGASDLGSDGSRGEPQGAEIDAALAVAA